MWNQNGTRWLLHERELIIALVNGQFFHIKSYSYWDKTDFSVDFLWCRFLFLIRSLSGYPFLISWFVQKSYYCRRLCQPMSILLTGKAYRRAIVWWMYHLTTLTSLKDTSGDLHVSATSPIGLGTKLSCSNFISKFSSEKKAPALLRLFGNC